MKKLIKKEERRRIVQEIKEAAGVYRSYFVGRKFLFVFDDRYIEISFRKDAFKHLVGVESDLSANAFYKLAVENKLQDSQLYFSERHPIRSYKKKIAHMKKLRKLIEDQCFMLEDVVTNTAKFQFATTEGTFTLCMGIDQHSGDERLYIVKSLRNGDASDKAARKYSITHIFAKRNDEKIYTDLIYATYERVPDYILAKVSDSIKETLYLMSIPGMTETILEGMRTPVSELIPEEKVEW